MQEEQTFYPVTTEYFTACLPLLEKYFGITAGYFNKELSNAKCLIPHREGNIVKYSIKEDCNLVLPFRHLECHDLLSLINSYGTITPIIEEALLLVAYCIREQQIDENGVRAALSTPAIRAETARKKWRSWPRRFRLSSSTTEKSCWKLMRSS